MRSIYAISTAIAFFVGSVVADNAGFNPVNFAAETNPAPSSLNTEFSTFRWNGDVSIAKESFEINVDEFARIQITDYKNRGDMFEIFDNDVSMGYTSKVNLMKDDVFAATPEEALEDDRFSKGVFELSKGKHIITIKAEGPHEAGTAAIRVLDHANVSFKKKNDKDDKKDDKKKKDDDDEITVTITHTKQAQTATKKHKYPIEFDLSHTITHTKTKWVKVTATPSMIFPTTTGFIPPYGPMGGHPMGGYPMGQPDNMGDHYQHEHPYDEDCDEGYF